MPNSYDLIVVSSVGFDDAGWPLPAQITVCREVAKLYAEQTKKPLILANALGLPNHYRINDPVFGTPIVQSEQTKLLLENLGVDPQDIVRGQFAIDSIGEGLELLTLLCPNHEYLGWMYGMTGLRPIEGSDKLGAFQNTLGSQPLRVCFVGPDYQLPRSVIINKHMFELAGVTAEFVNFPIPIPDHLFMRTNLIGNLKEMSAHIQGRIEQYTKDWQPIKNINDFFAAIKTNHGLFNKGGYQFHQNPQIAIAHHEERYDLKELYRLYKNREANIEEGAHPKRPTPSYVN